MTSGTRTHQDGDRRAVGLNLVGYLDAALGIGEVGRRVRDALGSAGVPLAVTSLSADRARPLEGPEAGARGGSPHPINLVCVNADGMVGVRSELGAEFFAGRYTVGLWWWEVASFPPAWLRAFDFVDEVWVGSHFVADALAQVSPVPVVRMPMPVPVPPPAPSRPGSVFERSGAFLFLFSFDYGSVVERKNPLGLIEAFRRAFSGRADARLVIKTLHAERHPAEHRRVCSAAEGEPSVEVLDRLLTPEENSALLAECDAYVSLHRSEGFGLPLAEAMLAEKPVIATAFSGPRDFLTAENGYPVDFELVPVGPGHDPYPAEAVWADPDLDHAARLLREVVEDPEEARRRAARARADVSREHAPEAAAAAMVRRLERIATLPPEREGRAAAVETGELERRIFAGAGAAPRPRGLRGLLREAVLRALRPQAIHQRQVDEEILRALRDLDERVRGLTAAQASLRAVLPQGGRGTGAASEAEGEGPPR